MTNLKIRQGEELILKFRSGTVVRVTPTMFEAVSRARDELIPVAQARGTMTYGELSESIGRLYPARGMGKMLDALSVDCFRRAEPSLAALVVQKSSGDVGAAFVGDAQRERQACYARWERR